MTLKTEKSYRFLLIADVHIDLENSGKNTYFIYAQKNFAHALEIAKQRDCSFIVNAGDSVTNASGAEEEWERYRQIIEESGYTGQIFEAMGNHETRWAKYGGCSIENCQREFIKYTRLQDKPIERTEGKTYYAYVDRNFGDAFVFLSLENGVSTNEIDNFSDEQMDWAEEQIGRYTKEGRRVFLIQHAPIYGFGAGDDVKHPAYQGSIRLTDQNGNEFCNNRRFYELVRRNQNMIWLSGHTHVDLRDEVNYSNDGGRACHMIHIPSTAGTTRLACDEKGERMLDRTFYEDASQGYLVDVFEDRAVFKGISFYDGRTYPQYTYTIYR